MTRYVLRRAFHSVGVALTVIVLVFFVGRMIGDPAVLILPVDAQAEQVEELRARLGLKRTQQAAALYAHPPPSRVG